MIDARIIVFAHSNVGEDVLNFILDKHASDLYHTVLIDGDEKIYQMLLKRGVDTKNISWESAIYGNDFLNIFKKIDIQHIVLAWWPKIIKKPLLSAPRAGIINFHPSYLPFNRGKDPNFWTIVEENPFGVSLQLIDETIDGGDVIYQRVINKSWTDTGETLYFKALDEILSLFKESYDEIRSCKYVRQRQPVGDENIHFRKELERVSEIQLDKKYTGREILNLLRARTFKSHPACYFFDDGEKYEVRIDIKKSDIR